MEKYASCLMIACKQVSKTACALHPGIFEQPVQKVFNTLLEKRSKTKQDFRECRKSCFVKNRYRDAVSVIHGNSFDRALINTCAAVNT